METVQGNSLCFDDWSHLGGLCVEPVTALGGLLAKGCKGCFLNCLSEMVPLLRVRVVRLFCRQGFPRRYCKFLDFLWAMHRGGVNAGLTLLFGLMKLSGIKP